MTMKVGFIGLGIMGKPMSKNLLKAGYSLVVADRNPEAIAEVIAAGAETAASAKAIAEQCDVIITMLPNSPHVKEVALGARLCDANGAEIGHGGGSLGGLNSIDITGLDARLHDCAIRVACDVTNPLIGDTGASRIFGPQKGATEAMIRELDSNLAHYADVIKADLHVDVKQVAGAGAAGGMGAALMAFLNAELRSGIEIVTQALNLEEHILDCSLVVTGEGRLDSQSINGKVPVGVASVAKKYHKPVIGIAGSLTRDVGVVHQYGIDAVFSVLTSVTTLEEAFRGAADNIYRASRNIAATLQVGMATEG